jgi:hypothetical protein
VIEEDKDDFKETEEQDFLGLWLHYVVNNAARRLLKDSCNEVLRKLLRQKDHDNLVLDLE